MAVLTILADFPQDTVFVPLTFLPFSSDDISAPVALLHGGAVLFFPHRCPLSSFVEFWKFKD